MKNCHHTQNLFKNIKFIQQELQISKGGTKEQRHIKTNFHYNPKENKYVKENYKVLPSKSTKVSNQFKAQSLNFNIFLK